MTTHYNCMEIFMEYLRDEDIPCVRVPSPILEAIAEGKEVKLDSLYLPPTPLSVAGIANQATAHGLLVLQMVGLMVRLTGKDTVRLKPSIVKYAGLDRFQLKRALQGLESAGLIEVSREPGRSRSITLLDTRYLARLLKA